MKLQKYLLEDHIEKFGDVDEEIIFLKKHAGYKYQKIKCCSTCKFSKIKDTIVYCTNKDFVKKIEDNITSEMDGIIDRREGYVLVHIFGLCPMYRED